MSVFNSVYIPSKIVRSLLASRGAFFRGFYCDDESIRYPYHDDTVSITAVKIGGIAIPGTIVSASGLFFLIKPVGTRNDVLGHFRWETIDE